MVAILLAACIVLVAAVFWTIRKRPWRRRVRITMLGIGVLEVDRGGSLLTTLGGKGVLLPSTCGGKGSCALCRCRVVKGGGPISDRETPFFTQAEVRAQWRLACQVVVLGDLLIELPAAGPLPPPKVPSTE